MLHSAITGNDRYCHRQRFSKGNQGEDEKGDIGGDRYPSEAVNIPYFSVRS